MEGLETCVKPALWQRENEVLSSNWGRIGPCTLIVSTEKMKTKGGEQRRYKPRGKTPRLVVVLSANDIAVEWAHGAVKMQRCS